MNQMTKTFIIGKIKISYLGKIILICFVISMVNSVAVNYASVSALLGFLELGLLVYFLIFKSIGDFTMLSVVLLSLSLERAFFASGDQSAAFYSMYNLPFIRGYLLVLLMLCAFLKVVILEQFKVTRIKRRRYLHNFYILNFICFISGAVMCVMSIMLNDNNTGVHHDLWRYMARDFYYMVVGMALIACTNFSLRNYDYFKYKINEIILGVLVGTTWSAVLLILLGNYHAHTWGSEYYIACPLILFFSPGLILFAFEKKNGRLYFVTGLLATIIQLKFTVGIAGTWWMYVFAVAVVFFRNMFSLKSTLPKFFVRAICWVGVLGAIVYLCRFGFSLSMEGQVSYKLSSFLKLFSKGEGVMDWYAGLGGSIQTRLEEIVNTIIELMKKPWFSLFGKGYGGSVNKYWGISDWNNLGSTFAEAQIAYRTYSSFHTAVAEIIINFGLIGIIMIISLIRHFIQEVKKKEGNMWIVVGVLWFVFFYTLYNSFNLGLVCLCYGLFLKESSTERGSRICNENIIL